jgi:hypothetical protein
MKVESASSDAASFATPNFDGTRIGNDSKGYLELIQRSPATEREGLCNMHFKVTSLDDAKAKMKRKGIRLVADTKIGALRERSSTPTTCSASGSA